jgi:thiamine biosynthesis lipoprotein
VINVASAPQARSSSFCISRGACVLLLFAVGLLAGCQSEDKTDGAFIHQLQGETMGTTWSVQLLAPVDPANDLAQSAELGLRDGDQTVASLLVELQQVLEAELFRINGLISTWDPESELSLFNHSRLVEPINLHADTIDVIDTARTISHLTQGRYDITLSPVIQLWGFGTQLKTGVPANDEIATAMESVGSALLVRRGNTLRKRHPKLSVDVSSLGKGFAVDQLGVVLESYGITNYLAEIGGELRARGSRLDGSPWKVGIEQPNGDIEEGLYLHNTHVASSGSYRNYREEGGRRISHIIDGSTGRPIDHQLVAVTVIHESTMLADGWATALLVVGEAEAKELIEQLGLDVQLTIRTDDDFELYRSDGFQLRIVESR